jgi:hypothetical protein
VVGAHQIDRDDDVAGGHHGRLGRALDQRVDVAHAQQVLEMAHVGVHELDPRCLQAREVELGPAAVEVVAGDDIPVRVPRSENEAGTRSDEAGAARDQDAHD